MSDQPSAERASQTTHNKHKTQTFMLSAGFETAIIRIKRLYTYALDRTATGIGPHSDYCFEISYDYLYSLLSHFMLYSYQLSYVKRDLTIAEGSFKRFKRQCTQRRNRKKLLLYAN